MAEDIDKETQEKQNYLRVNIMDAGYDANAFVEFLMGKKGEDGADVGNWSLPDLKNVVQEFIYIVLPITWPFLATMLMLMVTGILTTILGSLLKYLNV